jgi:dienelactone hydrolase
MMNKALTVGMTAAALLTVGAAGDDVSVPGPFAAGWTVVQVTRPDDSTFAATLYYPAAAPGAETPYDGAGSPYPAISFGHGYLQPVTRYHSTLSHVATWGYFVVAPQSASGLFPDHERFAEDLGHGLTWLQQQNGDGGSPFQGQVAVDCFGLCGHSMGGGASLLAAAADPRVTAVANLAAAETNPSAIEAMSQVAVPVRLISGSADSIVPPAQHGQLMYDNGHPPRQHQVIQGGYHCGFMDESSLFCDSGPLPREQQLAVTRRLLTEFFHLYLHDTQDLWAGVWGPGQDDDPLVVTQSDPGILLTPGGQAVAGAAGEVIAVPLGVRNTSHRPDGYALIVEETAWTAGVIPAQTPLLQPGETFDIEMEIEVPHEGPGLVEIVISARSDLDGATRGYATVSAVRIKLGDLDGDGHVTINDFLLLLAAWGPCPAPCPPSCVEDLDGDCAVGVQDFLLLLAEWG